MARGDDAYKKRWEWRICKEARDLYLRRREHKTFMKRLDNRMLLQSATPDEKQTGENIEEAHRTVT